MPDAITAPAPTRPRTRVPFWDNARFIAVTLVVVGHSIQRLTGDSDPGFALYLLIYGFHVPAFAIISGYFSKSDPPDSRQMLKVLTDILIPYVIFETIWSVIQFLVEGGREFNPTLPSWTLWFLLALGFFRLVLPYLALVRWPLVWTILASIGVGYFDNVDSTFSLSRAIGLLPFFVLGWKLRGWGWMDRWQSVVRGTWAIRGAGIAVLALWLAVIIAFLGPFREVGLQRWFFYDDAYSVIGNDQWWAGFARLGCIVLAVILSAAFFVLIPRSDTWFTGFGQATMYIYLLHTFVLYPVRQSGVLGGEHSSPEWVVSMVLAGIAISLALASPAVRRVLRPLVEPRAQWLLRAPDEPARASAASDPPRPGA